jgi:hypothetical protein
MTVSPEGKDAIRRANQEWGTRCRTLLAGCLALAALFLGGCTTRAPEPPRAVVILVEWAAGETSDKRPLNIRALHIYPSERECRVALFETKPSPWDKFMTTDTFKELYCEVVEH